MASVTSCKKNKNNDNKLKVLLVGTLPPPIGGAGVLLNHLINALHGRNDIEIIVVNTSGVRGHVVTGFFRFLGILWQIIKGVISADIVSIHVAPTGLPLIGPIVCALTLLLRKPFLVRKFGGVDYRDFGVVRRSLSRWVVKCADLYLVETKSLVKAAEEDGIAKTEWYPNNRPKSSLSSPKKRLCRNFVFLSLLKRTKGIIEILEAAERFDSDINVDVYGPFHDGLSEKMFANLKRVKYRGVAPPDQVPDILSQYDALLLPTYYPGEGYPGILLEAYCAGMPVITTRWKSIPEIVDETCGFLLEPKNSNELFNAMKKLVDDDGLFHKLCEGSLAKQEFFDSEVWAERFVQYCKELSNNRQ